MDIDLKEEIRKQDELLAEYLRVIEIQKGLIQELKKMENVHWMLKNSGMMHWIKQKRSVCSIMKQLLNWKKNGGKT